MKKYLSKGIILILTLALCTLALPVLAVDQSTETEKSFNEYIMEVVETYPTDGSEPYAWVNEPGYYGVTRDLYYGGQLFIQGDERKRSYCSGITFEVFIQAYQNYNGDHGLEGIGNIANLDEMEEFRRMWYGSDGNRQTIKHALEATGLGYQITDLTKVETGDLVQLWRHNGSGHTVVFKKWLTDTSDQTIGFMYWSSNYKKGPSTSSEYFGESGRLIKMDETYFMRVIDPVEWHEQNQ